MNVMHLANLDLNLLRVFDVLLEERSVTRAGARLGLTPSAVSHALSRLRYHLGDELFQRDRQGMQPTRKALEIGPNLHAALSQLQRALTPADFDPSVSDRRFSVVAGAYACAVLIPAVVAELQAKAPGVLLQIMENPPDLVEQLDSGQIDFVVAGFESAPERFARERLIIEALAWVVARRPPTQQRAGDAGGPCQRAARDRRGAARGLRPAWASASGRAGRTSAPSRASWPSAACIAGSGLWRRTPSRP